jgi:multiple sugar transport system substrate-binding protein
MKARRTAIALLAFLCGCSEPPPTMTLMSREGSNPQIYRLLDEWNQNHDLQIRATLVPQRDFMTKFGVSLAGGVVPDLVALDLIYAPRFTSIGQLTDITDIVLAMPFADSLIPSHMRLSSWQG